METPPNDLPGVAAGKVFPDTTPRTYEGWLRRDFDGVIERALSRNNSGSISQSALLGAQVYANMQAARRDIRAALERLEKFVGMCDGTLRIAGDTERAVKDLALIRERLEWL